MKRSLDMQKKTCSVCLLILLALFSSLFGCASKSGQFSRDFFTMDTVINITLFSDSAEQAKAALDAAEKEFFRVAALSDRFSKESDLTKINQNAGIAPVKVSDDVFQMVSDSLLWAGRTGGAFDIAIGPLMDLWDFEKENNSPPDTERVSDARAKCGYQNVIINADDKTVFLKNTGMVLDLGGVAKGYATDCAVSVLRQTGVKKRDYQRGRKRLYARRKSGRRAVLRRHPKPERHAGHFGSAAAFKQGGGVLWRLPAILYL